MFTPKIEKYNQLPINCLESQNKIEYQIKQMEKIEYFCEKK